MKTIQQKMVTERKPITRVTIAEVAKYVGVSASTVSHVMSGKRSISLPVQKRVFEAVKALDYRPNVAAQSLVNRKTRNIGVIVSDFSGMHTPVYLDGLSEMAARRGYSLTVGATHGNLEKVNYYLNNFTNGNADGTIVSSPDVTNENLAEVAKRGYPIVFPARTVEGFSHCCPVSYDFGPVLRKLVDHLYSIGHRRFAFLGGPEDRNKSRCRHIQMFIEDNQLDPALNPVENGLLSVEQASMSAKEILSLHPDLTAIVCHCDTLAFGAMLAIRDMGLDIPGDISVVGIDDVFTSRLVYPQLTTIRNPISLITEITINWLVDWIEGKPHDRPVHLVPEIILRDSIAAPRSL